MSCSDRICVQVCVATAVVCLGMIVGLGIVTPTYACGPETDCEIGERTYRIRMPKAPVAGNGERKPVGALVFMHGWRSNPANVMANQKLASFVAKRGLALVAPKSAQDGWDIPGSPSQRREAELPFFDMLLGALTARHGIDTSRLIATGFSAGGMMTWNLICNRGDRFQLFVPVAGTYWRPEPRSCATANAHVVHIHGRGDTVVPLGGRPIGARWHQGDVATAFKRYLGKVPRREPDLHIDGDLECEVNVIAPATRLAALCLHDGGHWYKVEHLAAAIDIFRALSPRSE